jgi:peptidoglycan/LPS O-acetylase OafA/YrhL
LIAIALYSIATASAELTYLYLGGFTVVSAAAALIIVQLIAQPTRPALRLLRWRPLVWVGRLSYGLYLWNFPVCYILTRPGWPRAALIPLQVLGTVAAASLSFYFIEQPFLRMKDRFAIS